MPRARTSTEGGVTVRHRTDQRGFAVRSRLVLFSNDGSERNCLRN